MIFQCAARHCKMFIFMIFQWQCGVWSIRFDEYDVSPLTVKALTAAGYVQMTKVQEATLSTCLEGMLLLILKYFRYEFAVNI